MRLRSWWLLLLWTGACLGCLDDEGQRRSDGEEWTSLDSFVVRCEMGTGGAWKARVLRCRTHSGRPVQIGEESEEDGHLYRCFLQDGQVRIRVRPRGDERRDAPATSARRVGRTETTEEAIPQVLCYIQGRTEPFFLGQEVEYGETIIRCGLHGAFEYVACLLPAAPNGRIPLGQTRTIQGRRYSCMPEETGPQLTSSPARRGGAGAGSARLTGGSGGGGGEGKEWLSRPGCALGDRRAGVGEEIVIDSAYVYVCTAAGRPQIRACVLPSASPDKPNQRLKIGTRRLFQGRKYQCKRRGRNAAALLSIPSTAGPEEYPPGKWAPPPTKKGPRGAPSARLYLASKSLPPSPDPLGDPFACVPGNLSLIAQGLGGGFVKRCVATPDGGQAWRTDFCYTPEGTWLRLDSSKRIGERDYYCRRREDGSVSLRVDAPAGSLASVTELAAPGVLTPQGPSDPTINSVLDLYPQGLASLRTTASPRPLTPRPSRPNAAIPGCVTSGLTRGDGESWAEGPLLKQCRLSHGVAVTEVLACLSPAGERLEIGESRSEDGRLWRCLRGPGGEVRLESGEKEEREEVREPRRGTDYRNSTGSKPRRGRVGKVAYAHCLSKDGSLRLRVGQRRLVNGRMYRCRRRNGTFVMLEGSVDTSGRHWTGMHQGQSSGSRSRPGSTDRDRDSHRNATLRPPRRRTAKPAKKACGPTTAAPRRRRTQRPRRRFTTRISSGRYATRAPRRRGPAASMASRRRSRGSFRPRGGAERSHRQRRPRPRRRPRTRTTTTTSTRAATCGRRCSRVAKDFPGDWRRAGRSPSSMCDEEVRLLQSFADGDSMLRCRSGEMLNFCTVEVEGEHWEQELGTFSLHGPHLAYCATLTQEGNQVSPSIVHNFQGDPETDWIRILQDQGFRRSRHLQPYAH